VSTVEQPIRLGPSTARVPRLALRVGEAAAALGVSVDFFDLRVAPELRCVRRGSVKLYAVREIERWLDSEGSSILGDLGQA
jgi:hypothetical protein